MSRFFTLLIIVAAAVFLWGGAAARFHVFPWSWIELLEKDIKAFVAGDPSEKTGLAEKLSNDLALRPARQLFDYQSRPDRSYHELVIPHLKSRRQLPLIYTNPDGGLLEGYRFLFGTFDFESHLHGAVLLDPEHRVVNTWVVDEEAVKKTTEMQVNQGGDKRPYQPPLRRLPQGVEVFPDGSIVFNDGDRGNGMHRIDSCGQTMWTLPGIYHHAITLDRSSNSLWTFGPEDMMQIDYEKGQVIRSITLNDIHKNNPELSLFTPRRFLSKGIWHYDPIHKNDIEALQQGAGMFETGDLLVSHRSTNLVFVFDPDSLKVKWWRAGQTRRQHDPDWQPDGSFTVFDNNLKENYGNGWDGYLPDGERERFSRIWKFKPPSVDAQLLYDGRLDEMYSGERSKHQMLPNGNILITSAHQGRALEVTQSGDTVFEFLNRYDERQNLILSEAIWLHPDIFDVQFDDPGRCEDPS